MSDEDKWDRRFMDMAAMVGTWSKDTPGVGAVIVDEKRVVRGVGYNGFPRRVRDMPERYADVNVKLKLVVHAEANAILNSRLGGGSLTLYCTRYPCSDCAKLIVQAGICSVVSALPKTTGKWVEDAKFSELIMSECGLGWRKGPETELVAATPNAFVPPPDAINVRVVINRDHQGFEYPVMTWDVR